MSGPGTIDRALATTAALCAGAGVSLAFAAAVAGVVGPVGAPPPWLVGAALAGGLAGASLPGAHDVGYPDVRRTLTMLATLLTLLVAHGETGRSTPGGSGFHAVVAALALASAARVVVRRSELGDPLRLVAVAALAAVGAAWAAPAPLAAALLGGALLSVSGLFPREPAAGSPCVSVLGAAPRRVWSLLAGAPCGLVVGLHAAGQARETGGGDVWLALGLGAGSGLLVVEPLRARLGRLFLRPLDDAERADHRRLAGEEPPADARAPARWLHGAPVVSGLLALAWAAAAIAGVHGAGPAGAAACGVAAAGALAVAWHGAHPPGPPVRAALLALAVAAVVATVVPRVAAARRSPLEQAALALGTAPSADLQRALDDGAIRLRFADAGPPPVLVLDVKQGKEDARLLSVGGRVVAGAPLAGEKAQRLLAAPGVEAALPWLLGRSPPRRALLVGLGAGVQAGALLRTPGLEALRVVEPVAGVLAAHRDPGDLFGRAAEHAVVDTRVVVATGPVRPVLREVARGERVEALLLGDPGADGRLVTFGRLALADGGLLVARLDPPATTAAVGSDAPAAGWRLRERLRPFVEAFGDDLLVLWPARDAPLLVVGGAGGFDPARLAARWSEAGPLREALEARGVRGPTDVAGLLLAGGPGVRAYVEDPGAGDEPAALARRAAADLPAAFLLPADVDARAEALCGLAEEAGARGAPSALPLARAAVATRRTGRALRVLGDGLQADGRPAEALAAWREALEADPTGVAPKLSIALAQQRAGEADAARRTLEGALSGDAAKDAPVRYLQGQLAMADEDWAAAVKHFVAAGELADAPARATLARELLRQAGGAPDHALPAGQRLDAAGELLTRSRTARDEAAAERLRQDAVAQLLPLTREGSGLAAARQADLGRALLRAAEAERLPPWRAHLAKLAHEALGRAPAPAADAEAVALSVDRARALVVAGREAEARTLLEALVTGPGARAPKAWVALGDLLGGAGLRDGAIDAYARALSLGPGSSADVRLHLAIAALQREAGRRDRALAALEAGDRAAPGHPQLLHNLGALLAELNRPGDALAAWRRYLEVAPRNDPQRAAVQKAVERLERDRR